MDNDIYDLDRVISYVIWKTVKYTTIPREDLYQMCYEGYLRALKGANPKHGSITLTYVATCMENVLLRELKKETKYREHHEHTNEERIYEHSKKPNITADPIFKKLESKLKHLPRKERDIVYAFYFAKTPMTLREMAQIYGITKQRVSQIKDNGIELLKEAL